VTREEASSSELMTNRQRVALLASYGATAPEIEELLAYNRNVFGQSVDRAPTLPLPTEPHVATWERYAREAAEVGAFAALRRRLVQLRFPIREGISQTKAYRAATLRGAPTEEIAEASGLVLARPDELRLIVHPSPAGQIPALIPGGRMDFVTLVRALTMRNEPGFVPDSMGACMVSGLNNWDRIREHRRRWETESGDRSETGWQEEFRRLVPRKELYQDRLLIVSDGPYSNVSAGEIGLSEQEWRRTSTTIRLEHECTHYFTLRVFGSMHNNLLDELIADYAGITAAGPYRADWFLRFMGLEAFPAYREGGRLENYRGEPSLSDGAFRILQGLAKDAAENLGRLDSDPAYLPGRNTGDLAGTLLALTTFRLEELAVPEAPGRILRAVQRERKKLRPAG
jgi:hypothetical protein